MENISRVYSEKGNILLVLNNYTFYKDRITQAGVKWRCTLKSCTSKLFLSEDETVLLKSVIEHKHSPRKNLTKVIISNNLKRKAVDEISKRPLKLIREEVQSNVVDITLNDVNSIRRSIYRARRKTLPPLPKSISEVHSALPLLQLNTYKGENFLLYNNETENIVCFTTKSNLKFLCSRDKIFVDGTFEYCAKFFLQLFTIHCVKNGHYIPLVFSLLLNKSSKTYELLLSMLKEKCSGFELEFNPSIIVSDFEQSIHVASKVVWPLITVVGCRFHLTQSWWKRIQNLGLKPDYMDPNSENGKWLHLIFGLSLLPSNEVDDCFVEDLMSIQPLSEKLVEFSDYLVDTYISSSSTFPPSLWAMNSIDSERTTNACESFHSSFSRNFSSAHPNIFTFVNVLKDVQTNTYIAISSVNEIKNVTNRTYLNKKARIEDLINKYKNKNISRLDFVKSVSNYYNKT